MVSSKEILKLAKQTGVLVSGKSEYEDAVKRFGRLLIKKISPLTKTQKIYLEALDDWKSLQHLAEAFKCTPQNVLKMMRVLESHRLVSKELMFKRRNGRGAWAFYYRRNPLG